MDLKALAAKIFGRKSPSPLAATAGETRESCHDAPGPNETPEQSLDREVRTIREEYSRRSLQLSTTLLRLKHLAASLDREEILDSLLEIVTKGLNANRVQVLRVNHEDGQIRVLQAQGMAPADFRTLVIPVNESSMIGHLARLESGPSFVHPSVLGLKDCVSDPRLHGLTGRGILPSLLAAPIWVDGQVWGILNIESIKNPEYTADEANLVAFCADLTGLVLQNALRMSDALAGMNAANTGQRNEKQAKEELQESLTRLVSPEVAKTILRHPLGLQPSVIEQAATVLFARVGRFTEIAERMKPVDLAKQMNELFAVLTTISLEADGTLDRFLRDGVMVLFGAPVIGPDDAIRAVLCGLRMQEAMERLRTRWLEQGKVPWSLEIAINTGTMAVGYLGSENQLSYTVVGDPVNVAAHLTELAQPNQILISGATMTLVQEFVIGNALLTQTIPGRAAPVDLFEIVAEKPGKIAGTVRNLIPRPSPETAPTANPPRMTIACPACGNANESQEKFCHHCGMPVF
jgi:class 3 adenylate cyclase